MPASNISLRRTTWTLSALAALFVIVWQSPPFYIVQGLASYLPLHAFAETFSIVISMMVFGVTWNVYSKERSGNIVILACALMAVGFIDFAHMLSYKGMPDFITPSGPEKAINLWLAARLLAALALLVVSVRPWSLSHGAREYYGLLAGSLVIAGVVIWLGLAYPDAWPHTFIEGQGLTPFKIGAEYVIIAILLIPAIRFYLQSRHVQAYDASSLFAAAVITILSELSFTLYSDVADIFNLLGHLYKIVAYIFIYRAVFVSSVREPYQRLDTELFENRRITEELRAASQYTRSLIEANLDPLVTISPDGKISDVNRAAENATGRNRLELIGSDFSDCFVDSGMARSAYMQAFSRGFVSDYPLVMRHSDGHTTNMLYNASVYTNEQGGVLGVVASARNITEHRRALLARSKLAAIVESSSDAIIGKTPDGIITSWNKGAEKIYGYSAEEVIGKHVFSLIPESLHTEMKEIMERVCAEGAVVSHETIRICKDGTQIDVSLTLSPIHDSSGHISGISTIARDITDRKQAELDRQNNLHFFESMDRVSRSIQRAKDLEGMLQDVLDDVLSIFDCDRVYLLYPCDPEVSSWSIPVESCKPEYPGVLKLSIDMPMSEEVAQAFSVLLETDGPLKFGPGTERPVPKDTSERFGFKSFMSMAIRPRVGSPWEFGLQQCSYARNWSAEEERLFQEIGRRLSDALTTTLVYRNLQESEAKYRRIVDTSSEGILALGPDMTTTFVNARMADMLGYSSEEMIGRKITDFFLEEEIPDHLRRMKNRREGLQENYERRLRRKQGGVVWVLVSATPIFDDRQQFQGSFAMLTDITKRKKDEEALRRLNRELHAISDCNQALMRAENEQELLEEICRIVCEEAGYRMAWVGLLEQDHAKTIRPVAWAGFEDGYLSQVRLTWDNTEHGCCACGTAIRNESSCCIQDLNAEPETMSWRDAALQRGYVSSISLPLKDDGANTFGVFNIFSTMPNAFTSEEVRLLEELAGDLAFGIVVLRARIERYNSERRLRESEEKLAAAFHASPNLIAITKMSDGTIVEVNEGFANLLGYSRAEAIGKTTKSLSIWASEYDRAVFVSGLEKCGQVTDFETTLRRKDGAIITVIDSAKAITLQGEKCVLSVAHDITDRKAAEKEIERLAFQDSLTLLPNRRLLLDRLHQALVAGGRSKRRGALLFIDLDNFKILNDTLGHDAGDRMLVEVAHRLTSCVREGDTVSRIGGDEFMLMLNDLGENSLEAVTQIKVVGEKIMSKLNKPYVIAGREYYSTPSVGVALFFGGEGTVDELMKQADIAMYQAKSEGRNTLRFFDPEMQAALAERAAMEEALRLAIEENQFTLLYQPQVDGVQGVVGVEVLIRWDYPQQGIVLPGQFIPVAEETGMIRQIGQWVLQTACKQLKAWAPDPRTSDLKLAINVSARQFRQDDFVDQVRLALEEADAPASRMKIELTESLLLDDIEGAIEKMLAIRQLGVEFALDDFGTGFSSLSYLSRLPLNQLKIDKSFIQKLPYSQNDAVIAQTIITMAKSLNLSVIAEGVEEEEQRQFLEQYGCSTFQGHLFSRPITLEKFELLLEQPFTGFC